jgi:DNA-directed RNA polymerase specialized sigma24 family protein
MEVSMARNKSEPGGGSSQKAEKESHEAKPLTESDRNRFLLILDPDPEKAQERSKDIRQKLIRYFARRGYGGESENLAEETLARAYDIMCNFDRYIFGIARNVLRETIRGEIGEGETIDISDVTLSSPNRPDNLETLCLKRCVDKLPPRERALIFVYTTSGQQEREKLAEYLGITTVALRCRIAAIRERLRRCKEECMGR